MSNEYQITEYNQTAAALTELRSRYVRTYDVTTTAGMAEAKEARATVRGYRVALEKTRVEIKAPALERTRLIDAEAKRITAELLAIEEPIDAAIKAEERRIAEAARREAEAKLAAERQRRREEEAKRRKAETIAAITSIADVKEALATMEILPGEAIDRAYELGFNDGANAGLSAGHGLE